MEYLDSTPVFKLETPRLTGLSLEAVPSVSLSKKGKVKLEFNPNFTIAEFYKHNPGMERVVVDVIENTTYLTDVFIPYLVGQIPKKKVKLMIGEGLHKFIQDLDSNIYNDIVTVLVEAMELGMISEVYREELIKTTRI